MRRKQFHLNMASKKASSPTSTTTPTTTTITTGTTFPKKEEVIFAEVPSFAPLYNEPVTLKKSLPLPPKNQEPRVPALVASPTLGFSKNTEIFYDQTIDSYIHTYMFTCAHTLTHLTCALSLCLTPLTALTALPLLLSLSPLFFFPLSSR